MVDTARIVVRGPGLMVTHANAAAEAVTMRGLVDMPLSESMWEPEYASVLDRIGWTVTRRMAMTEIVCAPDDTVGRVLSLPAHEGAIVTFAPVGYAIHEVYGPDLICGEGNDVYRRIAGNREYLGVAAREAWPEPWWEEAQDALDWVMRRGGDYSLPTPLGRMLMRQVRYGVVRTVAG